MGKVLINLELTRQNILNRISYFDIGQNIDYFNDYQADERFGKVLSNSVVPVNEIVSKLAQEHKDNFKINLTLNGNAIERLEKSSPEMLESFKKLVQLPNVEIVGTSYNNTCYSYKYSKDEFKRQIEKQNNKYLEVFKTKPTFYKLDEDLISKGVISTLKELGFKGVISNNNNKELMPNKIYEEEGFLVLQNNYDISYELEQRYNDTKSIHWPINEEKVIKLLSNDNVTGINLKYETLGTVYEKETGILEFFENMLNALISDKIHELGVHSELVDIKEKESIKLSEKSTNQLFDNNLQVTAVDTLYRLEKDIKNTNDSKLINKWEKLQEKSHFSYMDTKDFDSEHPYESPYETFIAFMNIVNDLKSQTKF